MFESTDVATTNQSNSKLNSITNDQSNENFFLISDRINGGGDSSQSNLKKNSTAQDTIFDAMESFICQNMENPMDFIEEIELEMKLLDQK